MKGLAQTALKLARVDDRKPVQADLRRAISTAYCAVFDAAASLAVDQLVGAGRQRSSEHWQRIYRALSHAEVKEACRSRVGQLGSGIPNYAKQLVLLQEQRHRADYDPHARFSRGEAVTRANEAASAIRGLAGSPRSDLKAFAIELLFRRRPS